MRKKIIDATVEEFKQNGLKFTMNDLAKRLGISKKTIYTVFESKQAVLPAYCINLLHNGQPPLPELPVCFQKLYRLSFY